jgi:thiamine-monophosphate kinase
MDDMHTTIGRLGEFALIDRITERLGPARGDTKVGAGLDDTAVLRLPDGRLQLATIDGQVAGVHFLLERTAPHLIGRKAAAVNLSDIAAMGGRPTHALAAVSAPANLSAEVVLQLVDGLVGELARWGADLVGGNLSRHDSLVIDIALLGEVEPAALLLRATAHAGDILMVTGDLGGAAAGLALMLSEGEGRVVEVAPEHRIAALVRQQAPEPRLTVAPLLGAAGATAAIDVSDGLAADAGHLCDQSGVGLRIEAAQLPISPSTRAVAAALGRDPLAWALGGGEDYELLFTAPADRAEALIASVSRATGIPITRIGTVTADHARTLVLPDGSEQPLAGGWRHFG